jgi:hypothetical protein
VAQIHELLPKVMADIGPILKDRSNTAQNYKFRGVDQALSKVQPALIKHGVTLAVKTDGHVAHRYELAPDQKTGKERYQMHVTLLMTVTFCAPDGSTVASTVPGEAVDTNGDKATFKAMSMAFKYALFFGLCIPVEKGLIAEGDKGNAAARQLQAFQNAHANILKEKDPAKLEKFRKRVEQMTQANEVTEAQGGVLLELIFGLLTNQEQPA